MILEKEGSKPQIYFYVNPIFSFSRSDLRRHIWMLTEEFSINFETVQTQVSDVKRYPEVLRGTKKNTDIFTEGEKVVISH